MRKKILFAVLALMCFAAVLAGCDTQVTEYEVTFMNGTEVYYSASVSEGSALPRPEKDPVKEEDDSFTYTFKGWSRTENGEIVDLDSVSVTESLTFHAVFDAVEKTRYYTVTFVDWDGKVLSEQKIAAGQSAVEPSAPSRVGYTFIGWDKEFSEITVRTEVKAQYKINSYTLNLESLGEVSSQTVEYCGGLEISAPQTPQGLVFCGWYVKDGESEERLLTEKYPNGMPAEDVTAYARFEMDWQGYSLNTENAVYGGSASVAMPQYLGFFYAYEWSDGSHGARFIYKSVGAQTLKVTVSAEYKVGDIVYVRGAKSYENAVTVSAAVLSVTVKVSANELVYGTLPQITYEYQGFVEGDEAKYADKFKAIYRFSSSQEVANAAKLSVGEYTVTAELPEQNEYVLKVTEAAFRVVAKSLILNIQVDGFVYGGTPQPVVSSADFVYGEDISVLHGGSVAYEKCGAASQTEVKAEKFTVGTYTAKTQGYASENYAVTQAETQFTVRKAPLTVTVHTDKTEYVYADLPVASYTVEASGLAEGDSAESAVGGVAEYSYASDTGAASGTLSVGTYTVTVRGLTSENYELNIAAAEFTVVAREILLSAQATQKVGAVWQKSDFKPQNLPSEYEFVGTLTLDASSAGVYPLNGSALQAPYRWETAAKITNGGKDVTSNFVLRYEISVTIEEADFDFDTVADFTASYTGKDIVLGGGVTVKNPPAGFKAEYKLGENGVYSEEIPSAVKVGVYTVYFRLSAPDYKQLESSYKATISQAENKITVKTQFGTYTYNGKDQKIDFAAHLQSDFGEIVLKDGNTDIVKNAGAYTFTVCVKETSDYKGAEYLVSVTVLKADYTAEQIPARKVAEEDILVGIDKTLADVSLTAGFTWTDDSQKYTIGSNSFAAVYCGDRQNYNEYSLEISFDARKEVVTVSADYSKLEADFGISSFAAFLEALVAEGEDGKPRNGLAYADFCTAEFVSVDYAVGGTYAVRYTLTKTENEYYTFVFKNTQSNEYFAPFKLKSVKIGDVLYTIEDALAASSSSQTLIVTTNTSFATAETLDLIQGLYSAEGGHYTVKSGVNVLLPYDVSVVTVDANIKDNTVAAPRFADENEAANLKLRLSVPAGITLNVNGYISVGAVLGNTSQGMSGHTSGSYAQIDLNGTLNVNGGGRLDAYGYVKGTGKVFLLNGGSVYAPFVVRDFKGGSYTTAAYKASITPFNQYELPNIQTNMRVEYGSVYNARASLYASSKHNTTIAVIVGQGGVIELKEGAYIETSFTAETNHAKYGNTTAAGRKNITLYGGAKDNALSLDVGVKVNTSSCLLGIPYNFGFTFEQGVYDINMQYKLLPGASFTIGKNATVNLTNNFIVYTGDFKDTNKIGYLYPETVGDAEIFVTESAVLNVQKGAFGGLIKGKNGARVAYVSGVTLEISSTEVISVKGSWVFTSVNETQTITKTAQLAGYSEALAAGTAYVYNGTSWDVSPLA